jgi:hypothetical protein
MKFTIILDDALYLKAQELAGSGVDDSELLTLALLTFVQIRMNRHQSATTNAHSNDPQSIRITWSREK